MNEYEISILFYNGQYLPVIKDMDGFEMYRGEYQETRDQALQRIDRWFELREGE